MGIKLKIRNIIIEIEYILIITMAVTFVSKKAMNYLDKYYMCLLFVMFHEFSHILIGTLFGKKLGKVFVGISGMTAFFKYEYFEKNKKSYIADVFMYLAGPMANILISIIFHNKFVCEINLFLGVLNLLPIYPLDGYNILKSIGICLFGKRNKFVTYVLNCISMIFICIFSVLCIVIVLIYKNISGIIFLMYLLLLNTQNIIDLE